MVPGRRDIFLNEREQDLKYASWRRHTPGPKNELFWDQLKMMFDIEIRVVQ
jgi:hypothetical protein